MRRLRAKVGLSLEVHGRVGANLLLALDGMKVCRKRRFCGFAQAFFRLRNFKSDGAHTR